MTFNPNVEENDWEAAGKQKIGESNDNNEEKDGNDFEARSEEMKILDFSVWQIPQFCILVSSFTLMFLCRFVPMVHLVSD